MKKILVVLLVVFLGVAMLTSCGEKKEEAATDTTTTTTDTTTTDPAATDTTTTDPAATDTTTTTDPAAAGVMEINELTLTPAAGWTGNADKSFGSIAVNKGTEALTLVAMKNEGALAIDAIVEGMKASTLKDAGEVKDEKVTYGTIEFAKLEYMMAGNNIVTLVGIAKDYMINITINGGITPDVESMLNSIVVK